MGKPKRSGSGFSATKPASAPKQQVAKGSADHAAKEQQAVALISQGKLREAEAIYRELVSAGTNNHITYFNLAAVCQMQGDIDELIELLKTSVRLNQSYPMAHYGLGFALQKQGDLTAAISSYKKALALKPDYPEAHNNLGSILQELGDTTNAATSYKTALKQKPDYAEAHNNLGFLLQELGDPIKAIASYKIALQINPSYPEAHNNLGRALHDQGDPVKAIASYKTALELSTDQPETHNNLGNALQELGDFQGAIASYQNTLLLKPDHPEAQTNLSNALLALGRYKEGWEKYDWRFKKSKKPSMPHSSPKCSQWNAEGTMINHKLLLVSEQGLGDTLQFMRYAATLRNEGLCVSLCAQPKLHSLIKTSGIDPSPLTPLQANEVSDGLWIPLLSVPRHLEVSPENPIITEPYIKTSDELIAKWAGILSTEQRAIIGINWQGNPSHEKTNSIGRSLPLETFAPIASKTNSTLLSLQKGFGSEQLETCSFKHRFVSCQDQVNDTWDFLETAAIIANCDLVITSDTSVAHLAAGMGKTTWLLLKKVPEWRWGLEGDTTFWYPTMRLFRQKERGNWDEVMEQVAEALQEHFGGSGMPAEPASAPQPSIKPQPILDILAPISLGELIDKITILQIKTQHLHDTALENVKNELEALETTLSNLHLNIDITLIQRLKGVNQDLWQIEDDIRDEERQKNFGETFIRLARSVYQQNDLRAAIKKEINTTYGSAFVEEKSYQQY